MVKVTGTIPIRKVKGRGYTAYRITRNFRSRKDAQSYIRSIKYYTKRHPKTNLKIQTSHKRRKYNTSGLGLWNIPRGWNI